MRRTEMMTAGGVTLAGLGALVGLAIGSAGDSPKLAAARVQPVEVRTEIIRRTVNVYRREHPHHATAGGGGSGGAGGGSASGPPPAGAGGVAYAATRTRTSGAHAYAPASTATPVVTTRSSGSKPTYPSTSSGNSRSQPVRTASSGSKQTSGSTSPGGSGSQAVKTRSSGGKGGGDNGGGHDD